MTRSEITTILGPIGLDWSFEEKQIVRTRDQRIRALVTVTVSKGLVESSEDTEKIELSMWGTAPLRAGNDQAVMKAIENCLMWLGFLPRQAAACGVAEIMNQLGPVGLDWDFTELQTVRTANGTIRCQVEVTAKKQSISLDGRGQGDITREEWGEAPSTSACPEDEALIRAVRNCMVWMAVSPDDYDVREDETVMPKLDIPAPVQRQKGSFRRIFGYAAAAVFGLLFMIH